MICYIYISLEHSVEGIKFVRVGGNLTSMSAHGAA